jgi:hypothetical protein
MKQFFGGLRIENLKPFEDGFEIVKTLKFKT